jgi:hypothetical protein
MHYVRIDPSNAFRLAVNAGNYVADVEYVTEMGEQEHELWLDITRQYTIEKFHDDMSTKIIWGPSQTLSVWVVDTNTGSKWKVRRDEHFQQMVKDSWRERVVVLVVDVVSKHVISGDASSSHRCASGVTTGEGSGISENVAGIGFNFFENAEGTGDACSSPPPSVPSNIPEPVDWANLIIHQDEKDYGDATAAVDEDKVYEAMGFWAADQSPLAASWSRAGGGRGGRQSEWAERYCHARRGEGNRWEGEGQGRSFGIPLV